MGCCRDELLPHAVAEAGPLWGPAREAAEARFLVEVVLQDHQAIIGLVEEFGAEGARATVLGLAIARAFGLQLGKENTLLFPDIVASLDLLLARAVEGLEEVVG